jgi:hypothetical protein
VAAIIQSLFSFILRIFKLDGAKLRKKVVLAKRFWKINAIQLEIKAKRGRTWKFKNRDNAKLGGLVKELSFLFVTQFVPLEASKVTQQNGVE